MKGIVNDVTANFRQGCYFSYTDLYASAGIWFQFASVQASPLVSGS